MKVEFDVEVDKQKVKEYYDSMLHSKIKAVIHSTIRDKDYIQELLNIDIKGTARKEIKKIFGENDIKEIVEDWLVRSCRKLVNDEMESYYSDEIKAHIGNPRFSEFLNNRIEIILSKKFPHKEPLQNSHKVNENKDGR